MTSTPIEDLFPSARRPGPHWRGFVRDGLAESDGNNILTGDATPPPGAVNDLLIDQQFENAEVGLTHEFHSRIFIGGSFRLVDYHDANELLDYEGEFFSVRLGMTF